jgi:hypothetical protein
MANPAPGKNEIDTEPSSTSEKAQVSLQVLFPAPIQLDATRLTRQLHTYDESLRAANLTLNHAEENSSLGEVSWEGHTVQMLTFGVPMPKQFAQPCIQAGQCDAATKERARNHQAHTVLYYRGESKNISEQYIALGLVAGALCGEGGIAVLNAAAMASMPAALFTTPIGGSRLEWLANMPPLLLFAGFIAFELEGREGLWVRTSGLNKWSLPDLAARLENQEMSGEIFRIFSNAASYMLAKGPILCAGHSMQIGEDIYMRLRAPNANELALQQEGEVLVAEFIRADESNPFVFNM